MVDVVRDVSVVVPVYNAASTLEACVEAVLSQDYPTDRYEAIFVDNGSTDATPTILARYGARITVLHEARRGASAARNAGARGARHDWIAFTDADCVPRSDWLKELIRCAEGNPGAALIGGRITAFQPSNPVEMFGERLLDQATAVKSPRLPYVISANLFAHRNVLLDAGLFDVNCLRGQDVDLSYRMLMQDRGCFVYADLAIVEHANPCTVGALFAKGMQHGRSMGYISDRYADLIGETAIQRLCSRRRYARIFRGFGTIIWRRVTPTRSAKGSTVEDRHYPLYDAVFNLGKQAGLATHILNRGAVAKDR